MENPIPKDQPLQIGRYTLGLVLVWVAVIGGSFIWNLKQLDKITIELARTQARTHIEKDFLYRKWNTAHGGVYVRATEQTPPNVYLDIPERDVITLSGEVLTLMNPAYMSRELYDLAEREGQLRGHLTSQNPLNPMNVPDLWEKRALEIVQQGQSETSALEFYEDRLHLRMLRPFVVEKGCLRCHKDCKEGEVRGGISVALPMEPYFALKRRSLAVLSFAHISILLIGLCGIGLGHRKLMSNINKRLQIEEALKESERQLRLVPARLIAAQEEERKRLAGELHDSIGQILAALKYRIETVLHTWSSKNPERALGILASLVPALQHSIDETRSIYMGLRPTLLEDMGLLATLNWFLQEFRKTYPKSHVEVQTDIEEKDIPEPLRIVIFRIVQEALNNVAKHSRADWVDLALIKKGADIEVSIADDGVGMDLNYILQTDTAKSLGLTSMKERAELTGGVLSIESIPGKGTTVRAVWSLEKPTGKGNS